MESIEDIFEMLDLFYANIHLSKKMRKENDHEDNRSKSGCQTSCRKE